MTVLLADNQPLTCAGLTHLIGERPDLHIVGHVNGYRHWTQVLQESKPDLLIVDYHFPGYMQKGDLASVRQLSPRTNTLVISADDDTGNILEVLQTGVVGYIRKDAGRDEIMMAIHATAKGEKFFSHDILNIIMDKHFSQDDGPAGNTSLTAREMEVLKLLASGYSTQRLAEALYLSPHTVQTHRKSIIRKLNIKSPTEFVIYAMDLGLIRPKQ